MSYTKEPGEVCDVASGRPIYQWCDLSWIYRGMSTEVAENNCGQFPIYAEDCSFERDLVASNSAQSAPRLYLFLGSMVTRV